LELKKAINKPLAPIIVVNVLLLLVITAQAHAQRHGILGDGELLVEVATIDGKAHEYNYIFINERRFRVSPSARIIDYGCRERPLSWLPTPCRAEITFRLVEKIKLE
jgi:hypothetical protein